MLKNEPEDLDLVYIPPALLTLDPNASRTHSNAQIRKLRSAIREFGLLQPILIDEHDVVIAGNARLTAACDLGLQNVPCIRITHLDANARRAYAIADNQIAQQGSWNEEKLGSELRYLAEQELSFDLEVIGFETAELDLVILGDADLEKENFDEQEFAKPNTSAEPCTQANDLWLCGPHRILCASATDSNAYAKLMGPELADMIFTDPPYNVPISGHVRSAGTDHREFIEASGEMKEDEFVAFLTSALSNMASSACDGSVHYVCMDWRHMSELLAAGRQVYDRLLNLCVWNKSNGGMGSFYRSKHELVFVWKKGKQPHLNTIELGKYGRYRTNVWDYAGVNAFGSTRAEDLADHPTVKPVEMVLDAILDCTKRGETVLDPFLGSGTSLLAAERSGRVAYAIELDPHYVDCALRRWVRFTGGLPVHSETGEHWRDPTQSTLLGEAS